MLSIDEVEKYMPSDSSKLCEASYHAKYNGAFAWEENGYTLWWLRSPGSRKLNAALVNAWGTVSDFGSDVTDDDRVVRPALWLIL